MLEELLKSEREQKQTINEIETQIKSQETDYQKVKDREVKLNEICKTDIVEGISVPGVLSTGQRVVKTCHTELDQGNYTFFYKKSLYKKPVPFAEKVAWK